MRRTSETDPALVTAREREERRQAGVCPRCGAPLESAEETNALTGKPLVRDGAPVVTYSCSARCGYTFRPYARARRR